MNKRVSGLGGREGAGLRRVGDCDATPARRADTGGATLVRPERPESDTAATAIRRRGGACRADWFGRSAHRPVYAHFWRFV